MATETLEAQNAEAADDPILAWALDRFENTLRLASQKVGTDRDGWLVDAAYWRGILVKLALSGYAQHKPDCEKIAGRAWEPDCTGQTKTWGHPCSCGLDDLVEKGS